MEPCFKIKIFEMYDILRNKIPMLPHNTLYVHEQYTCTKNWDLRKRKREQNEAQRKEKDVRILTKYMEDLIKN